jgi:hypothetical protein
MIIHSLRYFLFGRQLIEMGRIVDFGAANLYYRDIMQDPSTDWMHYESIWRPIYEKLMLEAFPKSIPLDNLVVKENEAVEISELRRALHFPGAFEGQIPRCILKIIKEALLSEEGFAQEFPQLQPLYHQLKSKYDSLCLDIQRKYSAVLESCGPTWKDKQTVEQVKKLSQPFESQIFLMHKNQIQQAAQFLKHKSQSKFVEDTILRDSQK